MDNDVGEQLVAVNGDEQQLQLSSGERGTETFDNVDDSAGNELKHSVDDSNLRDSSAGKLFVGGIAWETTEESFRKYFSKYGEIADSVIMMDKLTGRPRGFGFVTFGDPTVADVILEEDHVIDGRQVEVKKTVPREETQFRGITKTKKIFVGGLPLTLTEDELREYFSSYGNVVEYQIMLDHSTGRSRGFGFVTFDTEDAVEKILADGQLHELGGKQVEIKKAEPKRGGNDYSFDSRPRHGGGGSKMYGGYGRGAAGFGGGGYSVKPGRGYGGYGSGYGSGGGGGDYGGYDSYGGNYGSASAGFYSGYGGFGYGYGFGGAMYGASGFGVGGGSGGGGYGVPPSYGGGGGGYVGGKSYGSGGAGGSGVGFGGRGFGRGGGERYNNGGAASGRFHPYR